MRKSVVGENMAKSLEEKRRTTSENLHTLSKQIDKVIGNTKNEKYINYLTMLKDQSSYTVTNDKEIRKKDLKKVYKLLADIQKHLNHSFWNSGKIKRKLKRINKILGIML